jgi:hypothetical protein
MRRNVDATDDDDRTQAVYSSAMCVYPIFNSKGDRVMKKYVAVVMVAGAITLGTVLATGTSTGFESVAGVGTSTGIESVAGVGTSTGIESVAGMGTSTGIEGYAFSDLLIS